MVSNKQPPTGAAATQTAHALSDEQRAELWARIEELDPQAPWAKKRPPRLAYDRADVVIKATHPGGGSITGTVYAHDLSVGGMSFLYQAYLHAGTVLDITLPRRLTGEDQVEGRVARCRHASGTWHAVGVKFATPVALRQYVSSADLERLPTGNPIRPESLAGQVLMVDDQEIDRLLFAHTLRNTKLTVTGMADGHEAVAAVRKLVFDIICVDLNLGVGKMSGEEVIPALRQAGHRGSVVVISGAPNGRLEAVRGLNVEHVLAKPYDAEQLRVILAAALGVGGIDPADLIHSELVGQEGVGELLQKFCEKVQLTMREFRRNVEAGRTEDVRLTCQMLRGVAGGYGYSAVAAAATVAMKALDACGDVGEASVDLQKLTDLCKRITADPPQGAGA